MSPISVRFSTVSPFSFCSREYYPNLGRYWVGQTLVGSAPINMPISVAFWVFFVLFFPPTKSQLTGDTQFGLGLNIDTPLNECPN